VLGWPCPQLEIVLIDIGFPEWTAEVRDVGTRDPGNRRLALTGWRPESCDREAGAGFHTVPRSRSRLWT
jgi:hypothetical protein